MKKILILFGVVSIVFSCRQTSNSTSFEINKRVVYNSQCDFILYSTNKFGFFNPEILYDPFESGGHNKLLNMPYEGNYYVRDASCDCKHVILVGENLLENKYDVFLYELETDVAHNITYDLHANVEDPFFLNQNLMLFLLDGSLYSYSIPDKLWKSYTSEIKFRNLFEGDGNHIFLQDLESSIWKMDLDEEEYSLVWNATKVFPSSRKVRTYQGKLYFMGDHDTDFNTIYSFTLENQFEDMVIEDIVISDRHDHFLANNSFFLADTLTYIKNDGLYFVSNVKDLPKDGVLYDFVAKNDQLLILYASRENPASLYLVTDSGITDILQQRIPDTDYKLVIENKKDGVDHLLVLPSQEVKQWVVWLHGGPHEQVSYRFNPYLYHLTLNGIGVIALNYPGSTGNGNEFELRNLNPHDRLSLQLHEIKQDLRFIQEKYGIHSFSLIGVSYGAILAHQLAGTSGLHIKKLIDFSGINTSKHLIESPIETFYIMGEYDYILSNNQRAELLHEHKRSGARSLVLKMEGHSITHYENIQLLMNKMVDFLLD